MKLACSWSGGKDSALACYRAMKSGHEIRFLLNFISREHQRCCFHGVEAGLMAAQARCVGVPLVQKETSDDMSAYEREFREAADGLRQLGIEGIVFGDIYLDEHKEWVERVCGDIGLQAVEPLWNIDTGVIMEEFLNEGFKAVIISCKEELGKDIVGRVLDPGLAAELAKRGSCVCGENGEYHTLVVDGPIFHEVISIRESRPVLKQGFWSHWFLDIREYGIA
jgi:diphthine-ammonia ligase